MKVDILDIGSGNIRSIKNWIEKSHVSTRIISDKNDIQSDLLILPGVGSAGSYMKRMKNGGFDKTILEHVDKGKRLIGICLGFQIMAHYSEEDGGVPGLGLIDSIVERLDGDLSHNGWDSLYLCRNEMKSQSFNSKCNLSRKKVLKGRVFYNHEYGFINKDVDAFSLPVSDSLSKYSGLLVKDNIIGMQFHPEKSQLTGSELISMIL